MKQTGITNKPAKKAKPATTAITATPPAAAAPIEEPLANLRKQAHPLWRALEIAASLRITVVLFILSAILVFYGTWAQVDQGIWTVVAQYFRSPVVFIPLHVVLLRTIDPVNISIPFPGGWLLGGLLLGNLLAAHAVRFKLSWKRSGILLIHAGLILMMLGELITGLYAVEGLMRIEENDTSNYVSYPRYPELVVVDSSGARHDVVVAVPTSRLRATGTIQDEALPFDVVVEEYMVNSSLTRLKKAERTIATGGVGLKWRAEPAPEVAGTDGKSTDVPSAYVSFYDKNNAQLLGTFLLSYHFDGQDVELGGKAYEVALRPKRSYRTFEIKLIKFKHDRHMGTNNPKAYSSDIVLIDPENKEKRRVTVSMNNPLRYRGETFYQASFEGETVTIFQVVRNPGWLLPYYSCVIVTLGMLIHFGINLLSFLQRRMAQ